MALYDAFLSYSHAKDKPIAAALQSVVQKLGKPWWRRRALRVFRDDTSLSATPQLWPTIEHALRKSRYFILLASPEAAKSPWVNKEVAFWLNHNSIDTLLIGLTDGELIWNAAASGFSVREALPLPLALSNRLATEPKWVDLRAYRSGGDKRDGRFTECAADFAAAIRGLPKEDLLSEEVRQQRRSITLAWSATGALLILAGVAAWQWNVAAHSERTATEQKEFAENQRDRALLTQSQFLATVATQHLSVGDAASAILLAIEGLNDEKAEMVLQRERPYEPKAAAALYQGLFALRELAVLPTNPNQPNYWKDTITSKDGRYLVVTNLPAEATIVDTSNGTILSNLNEDGANLNHAVFNEDDELVAPSNDWITILNLRTGDRRVVHARAGVLSPDGMRVATADSPANILSLKTGKRISILQDHEWPRLGRNAFFSRDGRRFISGCEVWDTDTGQKIFSTNRQTVKDNNELRCGESAMRPGQDAALSPDGKVISFFEPSERTKASIWSLEPKRLLALPLVPRSDIINMMFSFDHEFFAIHTESGAGYRVDDDIVAVWRLGDSYDNFVQFPKFLKGHTQSITGVSFSSNTHRLVTASADKTARIWDAALMETHWGRAGSLVAVLGGHREPLTSAKFIFNGDRVVTASFDRTVRLWRVEMSNVLNKLPEHLGGSVIRSEDEGGIAYDRDRRKSLTFAGRKASVRDVATGAVLATFEGYEAEGGDERFNITAAAISPNGRFVVTGAGGGGTEEERIATIVRLWDAQSAQLLAELPHKGAPIGFVGFAEDGLKFATVAQSEGGTGEEIRIWDVFSTTQALIDHAKNVVPRCLTLSQRKEWSLDTEPQAWCIEMAKWPYHTQEWKYWLKHKRENATPPLPGSSEWRAWLDDCKACAFVQEEWK